jgi:hypothetical protein
VTRNRPVDPARRWQEVNAVLGSWVVKSGAQLRL